MQPKRELNAVVIESMTLALLELMQKKPFASITITELTRRAGVGRVSFYRNFDSKEDVLRTYLGTLMTEWFRPYEGKTDYNLPETILEYYAQHKDLYILLYKQGLAHISLQSIKDACGPKPEQPNALAYVTAFISYGIYGWLEEWFRRGMQETPKEMVAMYEQLPH